jgi:hypothetical protein
MYNNRIFAKRGDTCKPNRKRGSLYLAIIIRFLIVGGQCREIIVVRCDLVYGKLLSSFLSKDTVYFTR